MAKFADQDAAEKADVLKPLFAPFPLGLPLPQLELTLTQFNVPCCRFKAIC